MTDTKRWWASKTMWGALIALGATVAQLVLGVTVSDPERTQLAEGGSTIALQVTQIIGVVTAIYGRAKADKKLSR